MSYLQIKRALEQLHTVTFDLFAGPQITASAAQDGPTEFQHWVCQDGAGWPATYYAVPALGSVSDLVNIEWAWGTVSASPNYLLEHPDEYDTAGGSGEGPYGAEIMRRVTAAHRRYWSVDAASSAIWPKLDHMPDGLEFKEVKARIRLTSAPVYKYTSARWPLRVAYLLGQPVPVYADWYWAGHEAETLVDTTTPVQALEFKIYGVGFDGVTLTPLDVVGAIPANGSWATIDLTAAWNLFKESRKDYRELAAILLPTGFDPEANAEYIDGDSTQFDFVELVKPDPGDELTWYSEWDFITHFESMEAASFELSPELGGRIAATIGPKDGVAWTDLLPTLAPPRNLPRLTPGSGVTLPSGSVSIPASPGFVVEET